MIRKFMALVLGGFLAATATAATAANLTGTWAASGYSCGSALPPESIAVNDDGNFFQGVKITGDGCVTAGGVTFFGNRATGLCKMVTGSTAAPNSGTITCAPGLAVVNANKFTIMGITYTRALAGDAGRMKLTGVTCKDVTKGTAAVAGSVLSASSWSCEKLVTSPGDVLNVTLVGKQQ